MEQNNATKGASPRTRDARKLERLLKRTSEAAIDLAAAVDIAWDDMTSDGEKVPPCDVRSFVERAHFIALRFRSLQREAARGVAA